jgi:putative DNA methylase
MTPPSGPVRKKLIEVSIPLEAINAASAREKSIRHGHPSTLHLWWARRPLAACRAVLFAQLVDDPSAWPERFTTEDAQEAERKRLHAVIAELVKWENSNNEMVLNAARWEIARSVAWGLGEEPPAREDGAAILAYLQAKASPVYDPFCGGGSIPLEAQRLGLRAYGSDLNPVAVLISKALVEIPPKFAGRGPVHPGHDTHRRYRGAQGLAEDVRFYGQWMRDEAERRIGHLYPKVHLPDASEATVIAWLWARTVRSPDPRARGAMVPLVSSFMLSTKAGKKAWVEPIIDSAAPDGWRFEVRTGPLANEDEERLRKGTKTARGNFRCLVTGAAISEEWSRTEGKANRLSTRMMAIVAEGTRGRLYLPPNGEHEAIAASARPEWEPEGELFDGALGVRVPRYGLTRWADLFSKRQLVTLTTFSDLVREAHETILRDIDDSKLIGEARERYADAVSTYLTLNVSKQADYSSNLCIWRSDPKNLGVGHVFSRQTLQMVWDYCEGNPFSGSSGNWSQGLSWLTSVLEASKQGGIASISNRDSRKSKPASIPKLFSTDPPYYDNIGYADLSDFFYAWLRPSGASIHPDLFRRLSTPKAEELVATPARHGGAAQAHEFFMSGMDHALSAVRDATVIDYPVTIFYAFKQTQREGLGGVSSGWSSFLQAVVDARFAVDGTWPIRTELSNRTRGLSSNALASSVVMVCRKRAETASTITRADFLRILRHEMPGAVDKIRKASVGPVDMPQSVIGPGMGVFTRYARVLEDDDSPMSVRTALALINRVWGEIENDLDANFDPETQVALAWFAAYGFDARASGDLIGMANAKNIPIEALFRSGVFQNLHGKAGLTPR